MVLPQPSPSCSILQFHSVKTYLLLMLFDSIKVCIIRYRGELLLLIDLIFLILKLSRLITIFPLHENDAATACPLRRRHHHLISSHVNIFIVQLNVIMIMRRAYISLALVLFLVDIWK